MVSYLRRGQGLLPLPKEIQEYVLVEKTGWTLEYIRSLNMKDFDAFSMFANISRSMEQSQVKI